MLDSAKARELLVRWMNATEMVMTAHHETVLSSAQAPRMKALHSDEYNRVINDILEASDKAVNAILEVKKIAADGSIRLAKTANTAMDRLSDDIA